VAETGIMALCGKGGVGKTSVSAIMVKLLAKKHHAKILAIDADPAVGLATALGVSVMRTVNDIRNDLISNLKNGGKDRETIRNLDYEVFGALKEQDGYALLAIGRPEDEGCFCRVNSLLKDIIRDLAGNFDIVLIDGEAGIEQINRRVMKNVDHLVLVSDTSAKGINVANTVASVAKDRNAVDFSDIGLILNRVRSETEVMDIGTRTSLSILGAIGEDEFIRDYDFRGIPLAGIPDTSPSVIAVNGILEKMHII
jgi:CO dehydrogenase maturation factor